VRHIYKKEKENTLTETPKVPDVAVKAEADAMNLTQRIESVIKDVLDAKLKALELNMDKKIDAILKSKEVEMEQALRKGFGLEQDPVIHQSDLISAIRKAQLEASPTEKRAPTADAKAAPDGNRTSTNPIDTMFNTFEHPTEVKKP
jgi:hypothetical protein